MLGTSASGFRKERPCKHQGKRQGHSKQMLDTFLGKTNKQTNAFYSVPLLSFIQQTLSEYLLHDRLMSRAVDLTVNRGWLIFTGRQPGGTVSS